MTKRQLGILVTEQSKEPEFQQGDEAKNEGFLTWPACAVSMSRSM
jgi:hypothetical protein